MKYIKEVIFELKETTWIKPKTLLNLLVYTIVMCGIIALLAFGLDFLFTEIRTIIL